MKINSIGARPYGVLKKVTTKSVGLDQLKIKDGSFKDKNIRIYEEYSRGNLDLKLFWLTDKLGNFIKYKLQHISNGRIIFEKFSK